MPFEPALESETVKTYADAPCSPSTSRTSLIVIAGLPLSRRRASKGAKCDPFVSICHVMTGSPLGERTGLRYHEQTSVLGSQTVRRGGVGPVRSLLGGKPHRPLFSIRHRA